MKWNKKNIALLGIGLVFLFAMVVVPLGYVAARPAWLLPDIGPGNGFIEIDAGWAETDIDHAILPRVGTPMIDYGYFLEIA